MKKKAIKRSLLAVLALLLLLSMLFGCDFGTTGTPAETGKTTDTTAEEVPTGPKVLLVNGAKIDDYTVIYNKKTISGGAEAFQYLNEKLNGLYGVKLPNSSAIKDRYEILIALDGGDTKIADAYGKSDGNFIGVSEDGKKIFLMGVNYGSLCGVIDYFFAKATKTDAGDEIAMTENENVNVVKESITALSYNVQQDVNKAGRRSDFIEEIAATILAKDADVIGTQENTTAISTALLKKLPGYSCYKGKVYHDSSGVGDYVYWKTDKFNVIDKGHQFMSDTPNSRSKYKESNEYRGFTYLILESKETGKRFLFVNVHTDYRGVGYSSPGDADPVRVKQLKTLTAFLNQKNGDNIPMIIVGDFNATPNKDSISTFEDDNPRLGNSMNVAKTKGDIAGTLVVAEFSTREYYVYDYIFATTDKIFVQYFSAVDNVENGKYPSDHLPVVANLDIY